MIIFYENVLVLYTLRHAVVYSYECGVCKVTPFAGNGKADLSIFPLLLALCLTHLAVFCFGVFDKCIPQAFPPRLLPTAKHLKSE